MNMENVFGETIYRYTREQAIEDGILVNMANIPAMKEQWKYPMACTAEVWSLIAHALLVEGQDLNGICHDISQMAIRATRGARDHRLIRFEVIIVGLVQPMKLHVGPGDVGEPVLTLMLPHQD